MHERTYPKGVYLRLFGHVIDWYGTGEISSAAIAFQGSAVSGELEILIMPWANMYSGPLIYFGCICT